MGNNQLWLLLVTLGLILSLVACGPKATPVVEEATPMATLTPTSMPAPSPTLGPTPTPHPLGDTVWFAARRGLNALNEDGWSIPLMDVEEIALSADGRGQFYEDRQSGLRYLRLFDGQAWQSQNVDYHAAKAILFDTQDHIWISLYGELRFFDGARWITYETSEFGLTGEYADVITGIAMDGQGWVWVSTGSGTAAFNGERWMPFDEGTGLPDEWLTGITADGQGRIWVAHPKGISLFDGAGWQNYLFDQSIGVDEGALIADEQGRIWVSTESGVRVLAEGQWAVYNRKNSGLASNHTTAIAIDGYGRIYVGTDYGVSIFDGASWVAYQEATSGLADNVITGIAISGRGPATLPSPREPSMGNVKGRVLLEGVPLPGARVELCLYLKSFMSFYRSPCEGQPYQASTVTDDEGRFLFAEVPVGSYDYAIFDPEGELRWRSSGRFLDVEKGQTTIIKDANLTPE